ncbi:MAG: hypothetical protein S4CHLAM20_03260 [Chlamydiia bacterium]|nr:hypothetical protein [Chlamydiia bacterium]
MSQVNLSSASASSIEMTVVANHTLNHTEKEDPITLAAGMFKKAENDYNKAQHDLSLRVKPWAEQIFDGTLESAQGRVRAVVAAIAYVVLAVITAGISVGIDYLVAHLQSKHLEKQEEGATNIQALARGFLVRKAQKDEASAANIQALARGFLVRKAQKDEASAAAATKIQAVLRAGLQRREALRRHLDPATHATPTQEATNNTAEQNIKSTPLTAIHVENSGGNNNGLNQLYLDAKNGLRGNYLKNL